jgi:hypothetical protein
MVGVQNYKFVSQNRFQIATNTSSIRNNALHHLTLIKIIVAHFVYTGSSLIRCSNVRSYDINISAIQEVLRLILSKHDTFNFKKVSFKAAITEMQPRISWELVSDTLGSVEHTLGTMA